MGNNTRRYDMERERAKFAYECVSKIASEPYSGNYKSYVRNLPVMIKSNGLGAALAFVFAKKNGDKNIALAYNTLYSHLSDWLYKKKIIKNSDALMKEIVNMDTIQYKRTTIEVLNFLIWLKKFSEGLIEKKATEQ